MDKKNPYKAINDPGISMPNYIDACASLDQIQCIMNDLGTEGSSLGNVDFSKVPNVSGEGVKSRTSCLATSLGTHGAGCDMQGLYNNMYRSINLGINQNFNGKKSNIDFVKEYQKYKEAYEEYQKNPDEQGKDFLQTLAYSMFLDAANNLNKNGTYQGQGKNGESLYKVRGENGDYVVAERDGKIVSVLDVDGTTYSYSEDGTSTAIENNGTGIKGMFTSDGVKYTTKDSKTGKEVDITGLVTGSIPTDKDSGEYKTIVENAKTVLDGALDKDSSKWTIVEKMAAALYYRDLSDRTQEEEQKANENAGWATDELSRQSIFGKYDELSVEKNELEGKLKETGILEYTDKEKRQIELVAAKDKYRQTKSDLREAKARGDSEEVARLEEELRATHLVQDGTVLASIGKAIEGFLDFGMSKQGLDKAALAAIKGGDDAAQESLAHTRDVVSEDLTGDIESKVYNSKTVKALTEGSYLEPLSLEQRFARDSGTEVVRNVAAVLGGFLFPQAALGVAVVDATGALGGHLEENYNVTDSSGNYPLRNAKGDTNAVLMAISDVGTYYPLALTGANIATSFAAMKAPYVDPSILQIGNGTPISSKALAPQFNPAVLPVSQAAGGASNIITGSTLDPNWTSKDTRDQIFRTGAVMGATSFASWAIPKMLIDLKVPVIPGIKGSSQALMVQNPATMSIAGANYVPQSIAAATGARVITNGTMALSAPPTTINLPAYTDSFVPGTKVGNVTIFDKGIRYDYKETDVLGIPYNSIKVRNDSLTTAQRVANIQTSNQKSDGTTRVPSLIDPNAIILDKKQQNKHIPGTWQYLKENGANLIDGNPSNIGVRSIYCPIIDQEDYILELAENMHKYVLENGIVKTQNHKLDLAAMGLDEHTFNTSPDFANLRIDPIVLNQLHGTAIRQIRQNAGTGTPSTTRAFSSAEDIETPEIIGLATDPTVIREQTGGPVFYRTNGMSVSVVERNGQIEAHLYPNG